MLFQFTPLREGRPGSGRRVQRLPFHFNSRPSARGDQTSLISVFALTIFQFTPLREGRPHALLLRFILALRISIHAPPRGATITASAGRTTGKVFQFTPLREGRLAVEMSSIVSDKISIHAPPRGATRAGLL